MLQVNFHTAVPYQFTVPLLNLSYQIMFKSFFLKIIFKNSYLKILKPSTRVELVTSGLQDQRSNHLSYDGLLVYL